MSVSTREIKSFFFSQYFSDGLRITAGLILPAVVFTQLGMFETGLTISLGALCICVVDNPGPVTHKRNGMLAGNLLIFLMAVITGFARSNLIVLGLEITLFSFLFSILVIYGNRTASVGTAGLLAMIFMIDRDLTLVEILPYCLTILAGGLWYMLFSLAFFGLRPYRAAQQALGENVHDIADFLRIKANFYLPETNVDDNYHKLVSKQIQVSQHQDAVREILFKSRLIVKESTNFSRMLVLTFVDLVDLFEQIMATHYDYEYIRAKFKKTGLLTDIGTMLQRMAHELDGIGYAILSNSSRHHYRNFDNDLIELKNNIDSQNSADEKNSFLVLKKILINLRNLNRIISSVNDYHNARLNKKTLENSQPVEYAKFVDSQRLTTQMLFDNLNLKSAAFKYALRVSIVCLAGFILTKSSSILYLVNALTGRHLSFGQHSYWILLTIIVILKPGYSLSKQRNYNRLVGTIIGGVIGVVILTFIHNNIAQFILLVLLMIGTYSFQRINYVLSIILMTPYVLILFRFLGVGHLDIAEERIADTIIGSLIAFGANYFLFPTWEFEQLNQNLYEVLSANLNYLIKIADNISGKTLNVTEYKLARKQVYIKSANLSAAFERMTSEPKSKQQNAKDVHKFVVLNHILSSYISTIVSGLSGKDIQGDKSVFIKLLKRSITLLNNNIQNLGGKEVDYQFKKNEADVNDLTINADGTLLKEQLDFIHKISNDITKVTDNILLEVK